MEAPIRSARQKYDMHVVFPRLAIALALLMALQTAAFGQTRTAEIEADRDEKEAHLRPETVSRPENVMLQIKQQKILERLSTGYNGLRARFGNMAWGRSSLAKIWPRGASG
jgi:hypothetical protein